MSNEGKTCLVATARINVMIGGKMEKIGGMMKIVVVEVALQV